MKHHLYKRPHGPLWASQEKHGTTLDVTYRPSQGQTREEVIPKHEHIVRLIRTSFNRRLY